MPIDADADAVFIPTGPWENPANPFLGAGKNHDQDCSPKYRFLYFIPPLHMYRFESLSSAELLLGLWSGPPCRRGSRRTVNTRTR